MAKGETLAPMFMFQGTWIPEGIIKDAPPGSRVGMQDNGYFEKRHMLSVMQHIVAYTQQHIAQYYHKQRKGHDSCAQRQQLLLIVDGATCHHDAAALRYAVDWNITVACLPPHMTHIMQVSDVSVFGPFKRAFREACEDWRQQHVGKLLSKMHVAGVVMVAWKKATTKKNVVSGFRATGQYPFDPSVVLNKVSHEII